MTTAYTSLLGLALPVTGELQGTWGDTVNNSITSLLDTAVAGTTTISTDGDVTLSTTTGASNQARQAIILCSGARTALRTLVAPAQSKTYLIINATTGGYSVKLVGAGPTTGVTIVAGESALVAWNGTDFIKVSNTGGAASFTNVTVSGTTTLSGLTASTALALDASKNVVSVTNTGTGNNVLSASPTLTGTIGGASLTLSSLTSGRVTYAGTSGLLQDSANLTFDGTTLTAAGLATGGSVTLSGGTANGVLYLNGSKVVSSGSTISFDGTTFSSGAHTLSTGNLTFSSTAQRITGDMSNATFSNRLAFQTNTTNGNSGLLILPNGTGTTSSIQTFNNSDPTNASVGIVGPVGSTDVRIQSSIQGTGTYLPMTFYTGGSERVRIDTSGNVGIGTASPGYKLDIQATTGTALLKSTTSTNYVLHTMVNAGYNYLGVESSTGGSLFSGTAAYSAVFGTVSAYPVAFATNNTERMRIDSSGNVLVGTTSNTSTVGTAIRYGFDAASTIFIGKNNAPANVNWMEFAGGGTTRAVLAWDTTGGGGYVGSTSALPFSIYTNNTERMRIDSSGNVGIGVAPYDANVGLAVYRSQNSLFYSDLQNPNTGSSSGVIQRFITQNVANSGTTSVDLVKYKTGGFAVNNTETNSAAYIAFGVGASERMRIDSSGNVGIGAASPVGALDIFRSGTTTSNLYVRNGTVSTLLFVDSGAGYTGTSTNHPQLFITNNTERMRIDSSGNVGIGTSSPLTKLNVFGPVSVTSFTGATRLGLSVDGATSTTDYSGIDFLNNGSTPRARVAAYFSGSGSFLQLGTSNNYGTGVTNTALSIDPNGYLTAAGVYSATVGATNRDVYVDNTGLIGYVSSIRASKTNIAPLSDTNWLLQLQPVTFNYRAKDEDGKYTDTPDGPQQYGLIAEDVEAVAPDLCYYDEVEGQQELRGINYSRLITPLLKLVQDQQSLINDLTARVRALEAKG